jgi:hypothetical protein
MTFTIDGKRLLTAEGATVDFAFAISAIAVINDVLVVLLDVPPGESMTENVFGVSKEGKLIWQIERSPELSVDPTDQYISFFGRLQMWRWSCHGVEIDVNTGKIIRTWFGK